jgi:hypothetical protein
MDEKVASVSVGKGLLYAGRSYFNITFSKNQKYEHGGLLKFKIRIFYGDM